ncbi:MAG: hypothetical protein M3O31_14820 [Acidobacteriota bacterium]|nr:hypothetical protein [Acidobacteriota bacterium]
MRSASILFALLLAASSPAQTSNGNNPAVLVQPPLASACPVQLHVARRPDGAIIETSSEINWVRRHRNLSLPELLGALRSEPGFPDLSPQSQQDKLDRITQLYNRQQHGAGLTITLGSGANIVSADIVVHGYLPTAHVMPAGPLAPNELTETFHLSSSAGKPLVESSIWTRQMILVNWVELKRVEYADGTSWTPTSARQCGAAPSLFMLVN